jgi:hypothetical protein
MNKQPFPTVGRIIHYIPNYIDGEPEVQTNGNQKGPIAGIIARTWHNTSTQTMTINASLFPDHGGVVHKGSILHASQAIRWDNEGLPMGCWIYATENVLDYQRNTELISGDKVGPAPEKTSL